MRRRLEPPCVQSCKQGTVQQTRTTLKTKKRQSTKQTGSGHLTNIRLTFSWVFISFRFAAMLLCLSLCFFMSSFHLLSMFPHIHFSPVREFLVDFVHSHTAKTFFLRCCLYISWWQLWSVGRRPIVLLGMEKAPCMRTFQYRSESGGLRNPQTSAQLFGIDPGPHNGVGPSGVGNAQSAKAPSIVLMLSLLLHRHAFPLKPPATMSMLTNHDGSDCEDEFFCNTPFFWRRYCLYEERAP